MKKRQGTLFALLISAAGGAFAAGGGAGTLPWDASITSLAGSLTGGWAVGVATVALAVAFATLAFSNDLSGVGRTLVVLTISISGLFIKFLNVRRPILPNPLIAILFFPM